MKTKKIIKILLFYGLFLFLSINAYAQDPTVVAPTIYKSVLIDNDKVRVIQLEIEPGITIPWHSHPHHVMYALTSGKIEITDKGKAANIIELKSGDAMFLEPVTHMAKNIGTNKVILVVTEIKPMQ